MRRSISIATAADLLDTSKDTIRDMLNKGQLSGHYLRRERRVYMDSITEYQQAHEIAATATADRPECKRARRVAVAMTEAGRTLAEYDL